MDFDALIADIHLHGWNVHGLEVYADGRLAHAFGDVAWRRYPIYSATKTVTSIAVGMAADEGKLDITRSVLDYLPGSVVAALPTAQAAAYHAISLQRLMTMSVAGYPFRPEGQHWLANALCLPLPDIQQPVFHYSNIPAYLVGVAVASAVEEDLGQYLSRRLFRPLGIDQPPLARCPDGYFYGASGMELTVNELSRIGLLLYHGGVFQGQRLLSEAYVRAATSVQQMNREGGYGYFIWKYGSGFSINGKWGQKCYILPAEGKMITFLSHLEEGSGGLQASVERHILQRKK